LKFILVVGIPITVFFAIYLSLLLGTHEGLVPGVLIGLFVGGIISLILGFFYSTSIKKGISEMLQEITSRPKQKIPKLVFLPYAIVFFGAIVSRYSGHILPSLPLSIIMSISALFLITFFSPELRCDFQDGNLAITAYIITRLIPFSITFFIFLFALYGFDFEKMKNLRF
jgi:hypothetical protein